MKILDFLHNSKTQAYLAYLILIGCGLLLVWGGLTEGINNRILDIALLTATFYFGGSKQSATKDETIANLSANSSPLASTNSGDVIVTPKEEAK